MKKTILIGVALILMLLLLPSCTGVSQEEYDQISSELSAAQEQIQSLQTDLNEAQMQVNALQNDLIAVQAELTAAQEALQPLKDENVLSNQKIANALAYAEFLDIGMLGIWHDVEIESRFFFRDQDSWYAQLKTRAEYMEDARLIEFAEQIGQGARPDIIEIIYLVHYCLGKIESILD